MKLIDKNIPDGELVSIKAYVGGKRYFLNIVGTDDDCGAGIWNICADEITDNEPYYDTLIDNAKAFEKAGYSTDGKQWFSMKEEEVKL